MEVVIKRKYIYLLKKPTKDIPMGLWIEISKKDVDEGYETIAYTDIKKNQLRYQKPPNKKVLRAWIKNLKQ